MSIMWFFIGVLLVLMVWIFRAWIRKGAKKVSLISWMGIIIVFILSLFTSAWVLSCMIEGESRSAVMGLVIFGFFTTLIFAITRRKIIKDSKSINSRKE